MKAHSFRMHTALPCMLHQHTCPPATHTSHHTPSPHHASSATMRHHYACPPTMHVPLPPPLHPPPLWTEWLTHASENITLSQTLFAGGKYYDKICVAIPTWHSDKDMGQDFFTHSLRMIVKVPIQLVIIKLKQRFPQPRRFVAVLLEIKTPYVVLKCTWMFCIKWS